MGHMAQMAISWPPPRSGRSGVWLSGSGGLDLWIWRAGHLDLALGAMRSSVLDGAARQGLKGPPGPYSRTAGGMSLWCGDLGTRSSIVPELGVQTRGPRLISTEIQTRRGWSTYFIEYATGGYTW